MIAWIVGLIAAGFPNPTLLLWVWLFPLGLFEIAGRQFTGLDSDYVIGWLFYALLTALALVSRPRFLYFIFYTVLCILLILNIVGCQQMNARMVEKTH